MMGTNGDTNRLIGWKAIGQFLRCTERTARRWETERALPVYRVPGGARGAVWADSEELAVWLRTLPSDTPADPSADTSADTPADTAAVIVVDTPATISAVGRNSGYRLLVAIAIFAFLTASVGVWRLTKHSFSRDATSATHTGPYDDNPEAREIFINARFESSTRTAESLSAAQHDFRRLIALYPDRAAAWSGLADTYLLLREFSSMGDETAYPEAAKAARTAIALDPTSADAWLDRAFVALWWEGDTPGAFRAFETALRLDPSSSQGFHWYGTALASSGDFTKSLRILARARALDPGSRAIMADEAWIRFCAGQEARGVTTLEHLALADPRFVSWHTYLARAYLIRSRDAEFLREAQTAAELRSRTDAITGLHLAEQMLQTGGRPAMLAQLATNEIDAWKRGQGSAVTIAEFRALANDEAGMLEWLRVAETHHEHDFKLRVGADPELHSFRTDPGLLALLNHNP